MAGNDHQDFSKPVMVGCILGLPDAENHLDSILGKLEPFCTAGTLGAGATWLSDRCVRPQPTLSERIATHVLTLRSVAGIGRAPARRSLLDVFAVGQFGQAQDAGLGGGTEGGQQRVNVDERPISDVDPTD